MEAVKDMTGYSDHEDKFSADIQWEKRFLLSTFLDKYFKNYVAFLGHGSGPH